MKNSTYKSPAYQVVPVPIEKIVPNTYNPNAVAPPEMKLLYDSIKEDSYTMPIVCYYDKGNDEYIPVSMDEILQRMGATVTAEDFYKSISGAENQREMYNIGTKQYADALNGQMNGSIINNGGTNVTNYNTFQIYDATDPDKVARVVNREMTNLFTKIGNSIK